MIYIIDYQEHELALIIKYTLQVTFATSNAPFLVPESYMISWSKELKRRQTEKLHNQNFCDTINCFALSLGMSVTLFPPE